MSAASMMSVIYDEDEKLDRQDRRHHKPTKATTNAKRRAVAAARKLRLSRRHKLLLHFSIIVMIIAFLGIEGAKLADWFFVGLAVLVEVN